MASPCHCHNDGCLQVEEWKYVAKLSYGEEQEVLLGSLIFEPGNKTLNLINHNTALKPKVLLMGYTDKCGHHDIIGQFGEHQHMVTRGVLIG